MSRMAHDHSEHEHEDKAEQGQDHEHEHEHGHEHGAEQAHGHDHAQGHAHGHAHGIATQSINTRMALAVGLNLVFVVIEGGFGFLSNSVALVADAGHNLSDVLGLVCAWTAMFLGRRRPGAKFTYGLGRSSVLAALANAVLLLLACGAIAWEAVGRLASPPNVAGATVMGVAAIGIVLNGVSAWLLHGGSHDDLSRRSAFIHMLGDAAVSAGVLISGGLILVTHWNWLDPVVSLLIVAVMLVSTWWLLRDSVPLALDGLPVGVPA